MPTAWCQAEIPKAFKHPGSELVTCRPLLPTVQSIVHIAIRNRVRIYGLRSRIAANASSRPLRTDCAAVGMTGKSFEFVRPTTHHLPSGKAAMPFPDSD